MRSATTVFGGRVTERPLVFMVIIGICVVVWVAQTAVADLTYDLWFVPVAGDTERWRFLTSAFAHAPGNVMHILFNMLALWLVGGQYLEELEHRHLRAEAGVDGAELKADDAGADDGEAFGDIGQVEGAGGGDDRSSRRWRRREAG